MHHEAPIPVGADASSVARKQLNGWLNKTIGAKLADRVRLAASETVSNAVRHGDLSSGEIITLVVDLDDRTVRVAVEQGSGADAASVVPPSDRGEHGGFGLAIVESVSDRWGVETQGRVWFEVDRSAP